jgi:hypothetical protein
VTHAGAEDGIRQISSSEVQSFKGCRRNWWLTWYRGLRRKTESPIGKKDSGTRYHKALQGWYVPEGMPRTDPREGLELAIMEDRRVLHDHLVATGWDRMPSEHPDFATLMKANDTERLMVAGYMEWLEETGADAHLRVIEPEAYVEADLSSLAPLYPILRNSMHRLGRPVMIVGKLDVRAYHETLNIRVFIDHKTKDVIPPRGELRRDEQMLHYDLLEELSAPDDGSHCQGALYNVARRVKRTARAKPPFYWRELIPHSAQVKRSFRRRLTGTIHDMISVEGMLDSGMDHLSVAYPTPSRDCEWKCPFASVCTMFDDGSDVEGLLRDQYRRDDPLHYYGDAVPPTDRTGD